MGRKILPKEKKRVRLTVVIAPATNDYLREQATQNETSLGAIIDQLATKKRNAKRTA